MANQNQARPYLAATAKRLIKNWANRTVFTEAANDPIIKGLTAEQITEQHKRMREISGYVRQAFEADDAYLRDWFLFMMRYRNAVFAVSADLSISPRFLTHSGMVPIAKDTPVDRAIAYVQKRLAHKMAVCKRKDKGCKRPYFFRTHNEQHCSRKCADESQQERGKKWWAENGNEWRAERQRKAG